MAKGKHLYIVCMIALSLTGCTGSSQRQGEVVQDDSASAFATDSRLSDALDYERQEDPSEEVSQRVKAMFNNVYRHYAIADSLMKTEKSPSESEKTDEWDKTCYYSESLQALWNQMPHDDIVIDYDPWTMAQDYDTLVCRKVEVLYANNDSATVDVTIILSKNWPEKKIRLEMVNEKKKAADKADWYIADFQYNGSMAKEISDYLKHTK